jgi:hypothetical protein
MTTPKVDLLDEDRLEENIRGQRRVTIFRYVSCSGLKEPAETSQPVHEFSVKGKRI